MLTAPHPYTQRFKLRAAVYLLLRHEGQVLLALRQNTGFGDGQYGVVGGHLDGGENARLALVREAYEEAGIRIDPADLIPRLVMHRAPSGPYDEAIDFFFDLYTWKGDVTNAEPTKCAGFQFFAPSDLPENTIPYIRRAVEGVERGDSYIEYGWPVNI